MLHALARDRAPGELSELTRCESRGVGARLSAQMVLAVMCVIELISTVRCAFTDSSFQPVSVNVGTVNTQTTSFDYRPRYLDSAFSVTNEHWSAMIDRGWSGCRIKIVNFEGTAGAKINCVPDITNDASISVLKEAGSGSTSDMQIFVTAREKGHYAHMYKLVIGGGGTYSLNMHVTLANKNQGGNFILTALYIPNTNYIFTLIDRNPDMKAVKVDITISNPNDDIYKFAPIKNDINNRPCGIESTLFRQGNTHIAALQEDYDSLYLFDASTFNLIVDIYIAFDNIKAIKVNNLDLDKMYVAAMNTGTLYVRYTAPDSTGYNIILDVLVLHYQVDILSILNFGSFNYVGLVIPRDYYSDSTFYLHDKSSSHALEATIYTDSNYKSFQSSYGRLLREGKLDYPGRAGFVLASQSADNFQSYYLLFECCKVMVGGVCQEPISVLYFISTTPLSCDLRETITGSNGVDPTTYFAAACQVSNCWDCRFDNSKCSACEDNYVLYNNECRLPIDLPSGFGTSTQSYTERGTAVNKLFAVACADAANCVECKSDYTKCTECKKTSGYYLNTNTSTCHNTFQQTFGPNTVTGIIERCTDTNCQECYTNIKSCTKCFTPYYLYLGGTISSKCLLKSEITAGLGINGQNVVDCSPSKNCGTCVNNYLVCESCKPATSPQFYYEPTSSTCIQYTSIAATYGGNDITYIVTRCQQHPDCKLCQKSYTECTSCDYTTRNMYLDISSKICILKTNIIARFGASNSNGTIEPCQEANCVDCQLDFTVCKACDTSVGFYFNPSNSTCVHFSLIETSKGANQATGRVENCVSTGCLDCKSDINNCTKCDKDGLYYLDAATNKCYYWDQIANFYGANLDTGVIDPCSKTHCMKCNQNYLNCLYCDYSNGWYYDPDSLKCVEVKEIGNNMGACSKAGGTCVVGTVSQCTQTGCLLCQADNSLCTKCDRESGYYYKNASIPSITQTCTNYLQLSDGVGADPLTGGTMKCSDPGCMKCQESYLSCTLCNNGGSPPYYLDTTNPGIAAKCTSINEVRDGYGINTVNNVIEACADSHCLSCKYNYTKCVQCSTNDLYYLEPNSSTCLHYSDIPNGFGPNLDTFPSPNPKFGVIEGCQMPYCLICNMDYRSCSGCDMTQDYFLSKDSPKECVKVNTIAPGLGGDREQGTVEFCEQSQCLLCQYDTTICTKCDLKKDYYIEVGRCYSVLNAPYTFGLDRITGELAKCKVDHCLLCQKDITVCTDCDYMDGYYLEGNVCQKADTGLLLSLNPRKPTNVDLSLILTTAITLPVNQTLFYQEMTPVLRTYSQFFSVASGSGVSVSHSTGLIPLEEGIQIDITLNEYPPEKLYTFHIKTQKALNVTLSGELYRVGGTNGSFPFETKVSLQEVAGAQQQGAAVGAMMGNNLAITTIIMTAVALDPTGVLMKFNQILKVINKLYFININYGTRLTVFLAQIGGVTKKNAPRSEVYHSRATRGKFTTAHVELDMIEEYTVKWILYTVSAVVQVVNFLLIGSKKRWHIAYLYFVYYSLKVHLIIFNLVFIDFIWFGSRTLLHSANLAFSHYLFTALIMALLSFDLVLVLNNVTLNRYWRYRMREHNIYLHFKEIEEINMEDEARLLFTWKRKHKNSKQPIPQKLRPPKIVKKSFAGRAVDYDRTVECIFSNPHLFQVMATTLKPNKQVYLNTLPRSLFFIFLLRGILYQALILTGSYICGATICMLMVVEIAKIGHSVYCYVKYKYLKNIICLLMEVLQSFFLLLFLIVAIVIHPKGFDEIIMDFYQDAGIWIVIASCVAEYLLLITYIAVAAYEFFKNRTLNKRAYSHMNTSFIKYLPVNSQKQDNKVANYSELPSADTAPLIIKKVSPTVLSPVNKLKDKLSKTIIHKGKKAPLVKPKQKLMDIDHPEPIFSLANPDSKTDKNTATFNLHGVADNDNKDKLLDIGDADNETRVSYKPKHAHLMRPQKAIGDARPKHADLMRPQIDIGDADNETGVSYKPKHAHLMRPQKLKKGPLLTSK
jgi:hypothetical protein